MISLFGRPALLWAHGKSAGKTLFVMAPFNPDISVKDFCMTPVAPSSTPRRSAPCIARAAFGSFRAVESVRATRAVSGRALVTAGLLGCGLHLSPSAGAAPAVPTHAALAPSVRRSAHVLAQLPIHPRAPRPASSFAPRISMPDFSPVSATRLALAPIESPVVQTQTSAKQLRLAHRYFAQLGTPPVGTPAPRASVMPDLMPQSPRSNAPQFPSARFPAFANSTFAGVQELPGLVAPAPVPKTPKIVGSNRVQVVSNAGGGKMIQFRTSAQLGTNGTAKNNVSTFGSSGLGMPTSTAPAMPSLPLAADASGLNSGMKKVIKVPGLSLPPLSQPLPDWMKAASVRVDRLEKNAKTANGKRIAQNPNGAPVKQPATPVTNSDRLSNQIEVATSTFVVLLTTTDLQTVAVADPSIADVAVVNSRSVLLNGKAPGVTSLVIVDGQKIRQYSVRVTAAPGMRPLDVTAAIGIPGVSVRPVRDSLVLEGEVANAAEAQRAVEIAGVYATKVINQLTVRSNGETSTDATMAQMSELLSDYPGVKARMAGDTVILSGEVSDPNQIQDAETVAAATGKKVVNLIKLPAMSVDQLKQSLGAVDSAQSLATPGQMSAAAPISVRELGGQLVLEGFAANQGDIDLALAAAKRTGLPVVNRLGVRPAMSADQALASTVAAAIGRPGVIVRGTPKRLVLEGLVADTNEAVLAEQVARGFALSVDNLLQTKAPVQVNVDVTIAELNSGDARNLGVQYGTASVTGETITAGTATTPGGVARTINPAFNQGVALAGNGFAGFGGAGFIDAFRARLNFLVSNNRGRILSAPSTTVLSGRTATFQVGGQVPIPAISTVGANGSTTGIVFKDYGILLDVVPSALPNGVVTLRVRTEVSQPDFANGVTPPGGGGVIPGFQRRSTVTEVTVPPNGVLSLSGLIRVEDTKSETGIPILSKIPIIGSLFRSKDFRQNKTELVIFVRPRVLPNPLTGDQTAFTNPVAIGDNTNVATQLGNPGISSFNGGGAVATASTGGAQ